jgi:L-ascorbate metabolism protein UlaG (beta-lactamase superfamily)
MRHLDGYFQEAMYMKVQFAVAASLFLALGALAQAPPQGRGGGGRGGARPSQTQTFDTSAGPVKITPIYHASALIEAGGKTIIIDLAPPAPTANLQPADLMLITDIHGDHMNKDMVAKFAKPGGMVIAPPEVVKTITQAKPLANGEKTTWDKWTIEAVPMYNITHKQPNGDPFHPKGRGNGYVMTYGGKRFYFSGDTEGTPEMRALQNIDVAFLCMNMPYTMTPEEAADAVLAFKPKIVYPYHYSQYNIAVFIGKVLPMGIDARALNWYPQSGPAGTQRAAQ